MKNFYFDLCAIPVFLLILWTCRARKLIKGNSNRIFLLVNIASLICAVADVWMEFTVNPLPLSPGAVALGTGISFTYKLLRNSCSLAYLIYVFTVTKTEYRLRLPGWRLVLWAPYAVLVGMLLQNFFTHNVFIVTAEGGYARGPMLIVLYGVSLLYWGVGMVYTIGCRACLPAGKWMALLSVFALTLFSVAAELIWPDLMVEMFFSSIGMLMILIMVMRPEETIDASVNMASWKAYQDDLRNILLTGQHAQIAVIQLTNDVAIRSYIGEDEFNKYLSELGQELQKVRDTKRILADIYFERPATIYLMNRDTQTDLRELMVAFEAAARRRIQSFLDKGVRSDPRVCIIRCPEDLNQFQDILNLGHRFRKLGDADQRIYQAADLKKNRDYEVICHMDEILNRILAEGTLEMHYQPIFDVKAGQFRSAEALARVRDTEYGMISPAMFIPAAEATGLIIPIGDRILEQVFRFVSEHDLASLGLARIEINLSVAQCLQRELPETIARLQKKYGVDPSQVNFEVTETQFGNLSDVMEKNVDELVAMGYSFSLDDYGVGYSNIRRLRMMPLSIIKIDKSLVDDMFTKDGKAVIESTVRMMKDINKSLVVEGVETREAVELCGEMSCDYIQGYYYSKPLPEKDFLAFLRSRNRTGVAEGA